MEEYIERKEKKGAHEIVIQKTTTVRLVQAQNTPAVSVLPLFLNWLRASNLKFTQPDTPLSSNVFNPFSTHIDAPFLFIVVCGSAAAGRDHKAQAFQLSEVSIDSISDASFVREAVWVDGTDDGEEALEIEGARNVEFQV